MPTLYITEYVRQGAGRRGDTILAGEDPPLAQQTVAITGASTQSANLNAKTRFVRVHTDAICSIASGANPTATTVKRRLGANHTEYFAVNPTQVDEGFRIAVIANT